MDRRGIGALVVAIAGWFVVWFKKRLALQHAITYGPMLQRDIESQANLSDIYNSNDVRCVNPAL